MEGSIAYVAISDVNADDGYRRAMPLSEPLPDLAALDVFVTTVQMGSLSRAASVHGISQPAASNRIRGLERRLGVQVLTRSPGGSSPTAAGSLIAGWAQDVLNAARELSAGVDALRASHTGHLEVAASYTVAEYLLPLWLERFRRRNPAEAIRLDVVNSSLVLACVTAGRADVGFIESPCDTRGLRTLDVGRDRLVVVVPPGHAWARCKTLRLEQLASTPLVLRENGSGTREALTEVLAANGYEPPLPALEFGSTAAIKAAVLNGSGPAVLSDLAVRTEVQDGFLVEVPVRDTVIERRLRAVWRSSAALTPAASALLQQIAS
jgi:DNA-binding transcriptional LysR family regulator